MDQGTDTESLRQTIHKIEHDLSERTRELGCLYDIANVIDRSNSSLEDILQATICLLPRGFKYPGSACSRIILGKREFRRDNFRETSYKLASTIIVEGNHAGTVETHYTEKCPDHDEGPFLAGERRLIDMIAGRLGRLIEQKTTEDAIRRSEEKYRSIFENAVEGMFQTTSEGFVLSANPACATIFGYSAAAELTGDSFNVGERIYANAGDRDRFKEQIDEHGVIQAFQFQARKKDGTMIWVSLNARCVKDETGKTLYYEGTIEDVTLLKQAEQEARDNAERYHRLFDLESDAIFLIDNETGRILEANKAAVSLYGFTKEEILKKRNVDLSAEPEDTRKATQREFSVVPIRYHRKKNGTVFPVEITATHLTWNGKRSHLAAIRDITDRKKIEEILRKNEEEYRSIYDNAMVGIFQSTAQGRYLRVNDALASIHGFSSPEEMVDTVTDIGEQLYVDPGDRQRYMELLLKTDTIRGFEAQLYQKNGGTVWISMNVKAVRNPDGSIYCYEGIVEDITEHRQAEAALRESEERYRSLFDHSQDAILLTVPDGSILDANRAAREMFGRSLEDLKNVGREGVVDAADLRLNDSLNQRSVEGSARAEITMVRANSEKFPAEVTSAIFTDIHGLQKTSMIIRDITARRLAEEELSRRAQAMSASADGMAIVSRSERFTYVNDAHVKIHGYDRPDELLGKSWRFLYSAGELRRFEMEVWPRFRKERKWRGEALGRRKDGTEFPQDVSLTALGDGGIISVVRDVTEQKRLEAQLRQAQKMESIGTLAGGIAHDFNNILTSLMGYATLIQMKMKKENPLQTYVNQILSASRKAADLTGSLLTFSRQKPVTLTLLDMNQTIRETIELLKRLLREDIELRTSLAQGNMVVMADRSQMDQILFNLVTNARDAMPMGGRLTIETGTAFIDGAFIDAHGFGAQGKYVVIIVSDTGEGMDRTTLRKIFDPFFTTKETGKGTGLGLSTVYGIVMQHNGHITAHSEPGHGTTFHIYIPAVGTRLNEKELQAVTVKGGSETILIAEDNREVRLLIQEALRHYGYRTIEAINGKDALTKFKQHRDVDLLIADSVMPKMNGRQVFEQIRDVDPRVRVLFTSGYMKDIVLDKGIRDKEFDFIAKPISIDKLLQKVREILDR